LCEDHTKVKANRVVNNIRVNVGTILGTVIQSGQEVLIKEQEEKRDE